jgi:hypothetical protein
MLTYSGTPPANYVLFSNAEVSITLNEQVATTVTCVVGQECLGLAGLRVAVVIFGSGGNKLVSTRLAGYLPNQAIFTQFQERLPYCLLIQFGPPLMTYAVGHFAD